MEDLNRNIGKRLYIATVCGQHREILEKYGIGVELDQFCTAANMEGDVKIAADKEIKELIALSKGQVLHAPFNELFPAAIDPRARQLAMDRFNEAAELAMEYGAKKMVVHSGYVPFVYFKEWHIDRSVEFWNEFMEEKPDDFVVTIENVLDEEPYTMVKVMEKIKNPNIKLCLDAGHALCVSELPVMEWLEAMAPYLGHIHIHNNDGKHDFHRPLMDGLINMEEFLDKVIELCSEDTTITIESLDGLESMEWLIEKGFLAK